MRSWCLVTVSRRAETPVFDFLYADYCGRLEAAGIAPIPVLNNVSEPASYFDQLPIRGVVLTGGNDVSSGEFVDMEAGPGSAAPDRDRLERVLVSEAIARGLPVLGICRGMQFLNVHFGGGLSRSIARPGGPGHVRVQHIVEVESALGRRVFGDSRFPVNSYHDQGVVRDQLARECVPLAVSVDDGVIESIHHEQLPILGVQWHPEREAVPQPHDDALFAYFRSLMKG